MISFRLDTAVVEVLALHKGRSFSTPEGWLFANPVTGRPYHQEEIQKKHIRKAGVANHRPVVVGDHTLGLHRKDPGQIRAVIIALEGRG
jgi:hypothetical protein